MRGRLAYDWPRAVVEIEERDGWKNNSAWIFCAWWKTRQLRRRARWDSGTGTMPTKWPWKRCARRWIRWRLTERSGSAKVSAMKRRCCTSEKSLDWGRTHRRHCFRKWISQWTDWKGRAYARRD